ncbi:MAG: shikimate kinase [Betaproteobacteria bacterium]
MHRAHEKNAEFLSPLSGINRNIYLVGMMGAGKTSIGRLLSKRSRRRFYDSDHVIEERTGVTIPTIFDLEGEQSFRDREEAVIAELARLSNIVLATGGGAVLRENNRQALCSSGIIVYLRGSVEDLWRRTRKDKNRPLLLTDNPRQKLAEIYSVRDPIYSSVADIIIETGNPSIQSLEQDVEARLIEYAERMSNIDHEKKEL